MRIKRKRKKNEYLLKRNKSKEKFWLNRLPQASKGGSIRYQISIAHSFYYFVPRAFWIGNKFSLFIIVQNTKYYLLNNVFFR